MRRWPVQVVRHEMYDTRADVYSFGVLLAEILSQKLPYADLYCTPVQVTPLPRPLPTRNPL